ncbi:SafA/ExsA family spore coat assembly protein [Bacillus sp. Marseille-Q1617]|uniref:SafA/ExsA family spore coat assembly protein n=1 Tax=Bacillus sp. Marseille-Q1617 TaxID=2736887 RepID=UPI00158C1C14|nr:SafA/ExsA family spore coat assembly protein [Bacillus sp. Marseille-Q1617]
MKIHIVQKGDTLWKIAKKYGVNFEEVKQMNAQLSNPDMIMPGMKIKVPTTGGSVKKEAQIKFGSKEAPKKEMPMKEMPKAEHPFKEQKPITQPVAEEKPKEAQKPFTPKMPKPVIPEIDINNYYMMNMANMQIQQPMQKPMQKPVQQPKPQPKPQPKTQPKAKAQPKMPPKPSNILPQAKDMKPPKAEKPKQNNVKGIHDDDESLQMPSQPAQSAQPQGGYNQPMYFNPYNCVPVSPVMPGSGFGGPHGGMQPGYGMPMGPGGQVQGAMMPGMQQMPMMPGMGYDDESSMMPYMPHQSPMGQPSGVMGAQSPMGQPSGVMGAQSPMGQPSGVMGAQWPMGQPSGVMGAQSPMGQPSGVMGAQWPMGQPSGVMGAQSPMGQPSGVMGAMDDEDGYPTVQMPSQTAPGQWMPYDNCYPVSPVMPGSGFPGGMHGQPMWPGQVQGAMDESPSSGQWPMGQPSGVMGAQSPMGQPSGVMGAQSPMGQPSGVMGAQSPMAQPSGVMGAQWPMGQPSGVMGAQSPMGQPSGVMGAQSPMGQPSGVMGAQWPMGQPSGVMGAQSPMGQPSGVMGAADKDDCGCGGPKGYGAMPQGMQAPYGYGPGMPGQGMPMGQGMFGPRAFSMPNFQDDDLDS